MAEPATHATVVGGRDHLVGGALPGGAIAQVFKAFDTKDEHGQVAVKFLPAAGSGHHLSYERERHALERLRHSAIVPLLDSGEDPAPASPSWSSLGTSAGCRST